MIKRVAAIHDISGLGRCSLAMALPILSASGVQCCPLPTAVLSSQTDGYRNYSFLDLTGTLPDYIRHWRESGERFDAIYTGFLGSGRQAELILDFIEVFRREDTLLLVDPVMGDNGSIYDSVDEALCRGISSLARRADIITPNLTEAAILLGEKTLPKELSAVMEWGDRLRDLGPRIVVITGIPSEDGQICSMYCDAQRKELISTACIAQNYPGTGDMFASVLLGQTLRGRDMLQSSRFAAEFVMECAALTFELQTPAREGLVFEPLLQKIIIA